jgi:hypothetical protein
MPPWTAVPGSSATALELRGRAVPIRRHRSSRVGRKQRVARTVLLLHALEEARLPSSPIASIIEGAHVFHRPDDHLPDLPHFNDGLNMRRRT